MLDLPEDISLPRPRQVVPLMVSVAGRHPRLNLLNLEAVATAHLLAATVWLSPAGASEILPEILGSEHLACCVEVVAPRVAERTPRAAPANHKLVPSAWSNRFELTGPAQRLQVPGLPSAPPGGLDYLHQLPGLRQPAASGPCADG